MGEPLSFRSTNQCFLVLGSYVQRWQDWPFSSAGEYLAQMGHSEAVRIWKQYPVLDYGRGWDNSEL